MHFIFSFVNEKVISFNFPDLGLILISLDLSQNQELDNKNFGLTTH